MGSLINLHDYFEGETPEGYPFQGPKNKHHGEPEGNLTIRQEKKTEPENPFGYKEDGKPVNTRKKK